MLMRAEACGSGDGRGEKHEYGDGGGHERSRSWEQLLRRYPDIIDPLRAYSSAVEQLPHKESVAGSIPAGPTFAASQRVAASDIAHFTFSFRAGNMRVWQLTSLS